MGTVDVWPVIQSERKALASDLAGLDQQQWAVRSLCTEWTVRDVLAHMTATAKITPGGFFPKLLASGLSFTRMQAKDIAAEKGGTPADTLAGFELIETSRKHPPGPGDTMLGETIIHAQDIRGPLGIQHDYPTDAVVQVADRFLLRERDGNDGLLVAIDHAGDEPRVAQALVRPRPQLRPLLGGDLCSLGHGSDSVCLKSC